LARSSSILIAGYDDVFLAEARACVERSKRGQHEDDANLHAGAAASSIVAACAAIEAYVSESVAYHEYKGALSAEDAERIRDERRTWAMTNKLVKSFATKGLDSTDPDLYRQLEATARLRDTIAHRSAAFQSTDAWPAWLANLHEIIPHERTAGLDWTSRVLRYDTAAWAVDVAEQVLARARAVVPEKLSPIEVTLTLPTEHGGPHGEW